MTTIDWQTEALVRVRRARRQASNLHNGIEDIRGYLCKLNYWDEDTLMNDATNVLKCMIEELFQLEGKLSSQKGKVT